MAVQLVLLAGSIGLPATGLFRIPGAQAIWVVTYLVGLLASSVLSVGGVISIGKGLGIGLIGRALLVVAVFIPLVNIVTLLVLSSRVTRALRAAGIHVGLMGARA